MTRAHVSFLIALLAITGTLGYIVCVITASHYAVTYGIGYIILLLTAPLVSRWVHRR